MKENRKKKDRGEKRSRLSSVKIVFVYVVFGLLWIFLSDSLVGFFISDPEIITQLSIYKGFLYVFSTALLLYFLIHRYLSEIYSADEARRRFLTYMSHEIRNPLGSILGMIRLLNRTALHPEQSKYIKMMEESGQLLHGMVNEVLELARIESGKYELKNKEFDLNDWLEKIVEPYRVNYQNKGLEFTCEIQKGMPRYFSGPVSAISQVLMNLLNNSLKYTEKGFVKVSLDKVNVPAEASKAEFPVTLRIKVADSGVGFSKDKINLLFCEFERLGAEKKFSGTGLGLVIVRELLNRMGGRIEVESKPGEGSEFRFEVPLKAYSSLSLKKEDSLVQSSKDVKPIAVEATQVLVVEDDAINRFYLEKLLENEGYAVLGLENGIKALETAKKRRFDIILLDIQLPEMNGLEVIERIRLFEKEYSVYTPIIALSAHALEEDKMKAVAAGVDDYITKPIDEQELLKSIERLISQK